VLYVQFVFIFSASPHYETKKLVKHVHFIYFLLKWWNRVSDKQNGNECM